MPTDRDSLQRARREHAAALARGDAEAADLLARAIAELEREATDDVRAHGCGGAG